MFELRRGRLHFPLQDGDPLVALLELPPLLLKRLLVGRDGIVGLLGYVIGIGVTAILGGIGAAIYAWLFNIAAGRVGGLEVEIS